VPPFGSRSSFLYTMAVAVMRPRSSSGFHSNLPRTCGLRTGPAIAADAVLARKPSDKVILPPRESLGLQGPSCISTDQGSNRSQGIKNVGRPSSNRSQPARRKAMLPERTPLPSSLPGASRPQAARSSLLSRGPSSRNDSVARRASSNAAAAAAQSAALTRLQRSEVGRSRSCSVAGRASVRASVSKPRGAGGEPVPPISTMLHSSSTSDSAASECLEILSNHSHDSDEKSPASLLERRKMAAEPADADGGAQRLRRQKSSKTKLPLPSPGVEETFEPCEWLSDASISFASACLASLGSSVLSSKRQKLPKTVSIMDPAMAFWLALQENPEEVAEARKALNLRDTELLLCPINDSNDPEQTDSGLHWTLLVCWGKKSSSSASRDSRVSADSASHLQNFRYYDSLGYCSFSRDPGLRQAQELAGRLAGRPVEVSVGSCARQMNFFDCGIYALLFSEIIIDVFLELGRHASCSDGQEPSWEERLNTVTPEDASTCRVHYLNLARGGLSD